MPTPKHFRFFRPLVVSVLLLLSLAIFYGQMLPKGSIHHGDEYLTLDRTHSFTLRDDWLTVYSENRPTFKKPPLQYWVGALLLEAGIDKELALRLPSFVSALGILVITGLFAWMMVPANLWSIPIAILLIASSKRFWESAMSALLDSGAVLFAMIALIATYAAIRQPKWWYLVALACGLGAMQKAPIPILFSVAGFVGVFLTRSHHELLNGTSLRNRHFYLALTLGLGLVLCWPIVQWLYHGQESLQQAYLDQMVERFSPFGEEKGKQRSLYTLLIAGEPVLRILAAGAMFWMPWRLRRLDLISFPVLFALYAIVVVGSSGLVSPRYSLVFMPMLMSSLAVMILTVVPDWRWQAAFVAVLCLASFSPFKSAENLGITNSSQAGVIQLLASIGEVIRPEETLLVCRRGVEGERIYPGAVSYYASAGKPFHRFRSPNELIQLQENEMISPPYRLLCGVSGYEELRPTMTGINVMETTGKYVHWTASGLSTGR